MDYKVDRETAKNDADRFAEAMDLDIDDEALEELDQVESADLKSAKMKLVRAIRKGNVTIDDDGCAVVHTGEKDLKFYKPKGSHWTEIDKRKEHHRMAQVNASMGAICKVNAVAFTKMDDSYRKICVNIWTLLNLG